MLPEEVSQQLARYLISTTSGSPSHNTSRTTISTANLVSSMPFTFDAEDVQPLQTLVTPELPSREEIEAHGIDHWPYRSWCKVCVEGLAASAITVMGT